MAVALPIAAFFVAIDLLFFGANMLKVLHGGWFPLLVSGAILFLMLTWRKGRKVLGLRIKEMTVPLEMFIQDCGTQRFQRVPGTAVFMSGNSKGAPLSMLHNLKHNKVLHQQIVVLTVITEEVPYVSDPTHRARLEKLPEDFWRVRLHYGFMEKPDVPAALAAIKDPVLQFHPMKTTYFIGRETVLSTRRPDLSFWRGAMFAWMTRNTGDVTSYFGLPPGSVVELGARVEV
jgi:KUP system potassium uptake protein